MFLLCVFFLFFTCRWPKTLAHSLHLPVSLEDVSRFEFLDVSLPEDCKLTFGQISFFIEFETSGLLGLRKASLSCQLHSTTLTKRPMICWIGSVQSFTQRSALDINLHPVMRLQFGMLERWTYNFITITPLFNRLGLWNTSTAER